MDLKIKLNRFHRGILGATGVGIIVLQTISLAAGDFELYGVGWFLAYAVGVFMVIAATYSPYGQAEKVTQPTKQVDLLDEPLVKAGGHMGWRVFKIALWAIAVFLCGVQIFIMSGKQLPAAACLLMAAFIVTALYKVARPYVQKWWRNFKTNP